MSLLDRRSRTQEEKDSTIIGLVLLVLTQLLFWTIHGTAFWVVNSWMLTGIAGTGTLIFLRRDDFDVVEVLASIGWGYFSGLSAAGIIFLRKRFR